MKKYWHIWVGFAILLLTALIVLGFVFLPRLAAKSDMRELLVLAAAPDAQYVMLIDPTYVHPGLLAGQGREVRLEGELLEQTRAALSRLSEDFSYKAKEDALSRAFGMHLLIKTAEGEILKVYFSESDFYAVLKGNAYHFSADNAQDYAAIYAMMNNALAQ